MLLISLQLKTKVFSILWFWNFGENFLFFGKKISNLNPKKENFQ